MLSLNVFCNINNLKISYAKSMICLLVQFSKNECKQRKLLGFYFDCLPRVIMSISDANLKLYNEISFEELVNVFWNNHNPTTLNRQGPDIGIQYRSAIFYHNDEQKQIAEKSKQELDSSNRYDNPIVTEILPAPTFYNAEEYHQKYFQKNGLS